MTTTATAAIAYTQNQTTLSMLGLWATGSGRITYLGPASPAEIQFAFTGNKIEFRGESSSVLGVYIDGVLVTPANAIPAISRSFILTNIWNGTEGAHVCRLVFGGQTELPTLSDVIKITSSATAAVSPNGFISYSVCNSGSTSTIAPYVDNNDSSPNVRLEGHFYQSSQNAVTDIGLLGNAVALRFKSRCSRIALWCQGSLAKIMVAVDGIDRQTTFIPAVGGAPFGLYTVADGLDSGDNAGHGVLHEYVVKVTQGGTGIQNVCIYDDTLTTALTARLKWAFLGDSITSGSVTTLAGIRNGMPGYQLDEWISYCHKFAQANARQDVNCGQVSTTVVDYTGHLIVGGIPPLAAQSTLCTSGTIRISQLPPDAEIVWVNAGINDMGTLFTATPAMTIAGDFQPAYTLMLNRILTQCTTAQIKVMSIWPSYGGGAAAYNAANHVIFNTAIQAAITACNFPARCQYINTDGWYDSTIQGVCLTDGIHPTYDTYVNQIVPKLCMATGTRMTAASVLDSLGGSGFRGTIGL